VYYYVKLKRKDKLVKMRAQRDSQRTLENLLLAMGVKHQGNRISARKEFTETGSDEAKNALIEASLLVYGICQLAEASGISSYPIFEKKIDSLITGIRNGDNAFREEK
jgi:hypothetical protein